MNENLATILIVEDDSFQCTLLERLLEKAGYRSASAHSGGEALALLGRQQPDLILADEPVSALDPTLALNTIRLLVDEAQTRGATLVASLHAVDLALGNFTRIVGVKGGRIAFDLPTMQVQPAQLQALYANEQLQATPSSPAPPQPTHIPRC